MIMLILKEFPFLQDASFYLRGFSIEEIYLLVFGQNFCRILLVNLRAAAGRVALRY